MAHVRFRHIMLMQTSAGKDTGTETGTLESTAKFSAEISVIQITNTSDLLMKMSDYDSREF